MTKLARLVNRAPWLLTLFSLPLVMILAMVLGTLTDHYANGFELSASVKICLLMSVPALAFILYLVVKIADKSDEIEDDESSGRGNRHR